MLRGDQTVAMSIAGKAAYTDYSFSSMYCVTSFIPTFVRILWRGHDLPDVGILDMFNSCYCRPNSCKCNTSRWTGVL